MRVFKTKPFARFAEASGLEDDALLEVLQQMQTGLIHADLGGHVFKQRIARPGAGKSAGYRVLIVLRLEERAFFIHGFAKNSRSNIGIKDLRAFRMLAQHLLALSDDDLNVATADHALFEVHNHEEEGN